MMKKAAILIGFTASVALGFLVSVVTYRANKDPVDPWGTVFVQLKDSKDSFTLSELRKSADTYLLAKDPSIDPTKFGVGATIYESQSNRFVDFYYYKDIGATVFVLTIGRDGKVIGMQKGIATE